MLSSLFATKPQQDDSAGPSIRTENQVSKEGTSRASRSLTRDLLTPHDAVLSELYQKPSPRNDGVPDTAPVLASHGLPDPFSREAIHNPFNGQNFGALVLPDPHLHPEAHKPLSDSASRNEDIWSHLSTVLDLQSQIAALHLEMEGVAGNDHGKGVGKSRTTNAGSRPPVRAVSGTAELLELEHDEGVGVGEDESEEQKRDREREEDFKKLAAQFEGRKESVNNIMSKLDELSKALTEFHDLQAPNINFPSSRHNSIPVTSPSMSQSNKLSVLLPPITSPKSPSDRSTSILSPSRMLESPDSAESHEFR
ncbi:hypothetical protein GYMLUDRAFT_32730 [Collybiopsis luxurians FD-317 M1]|nr:hypothetical protein GYMLUDRAFT_32730 [Collybiopsis luxurians FD-317 M1]